jgi:hypothetical protein
LSFNHPEQRFSEAPFSLVQLSKLRTQTSKKLAFAKFYFPPLIESLSKQLDVIVLSFIPMHPDATLMPVKALRCKKPTSLF